MDKEQRSTRIFALAILVIRVWWVYTKSQRFALIINILTKRTLINIDNEGERDAFISLMDTKTKVYCNFLLGFVFEFIKFPKSSMRALGECALR